MKIRNFFSNQIALSLLLIISCVSILSAETTEVPKLKMRLPNWRMNVVEKHADGSPWQILYTEPVPLTDKEVAVRLVTYREDGSLHEEVDLLAVDPTDPLYKKFGSSAIPHGPCVTYNQAGYLESITLYNFGEKHGPSKTFFSTGVLKSTSYYSNGLRNGTYEYKHENGR